MGDVLDEVVAPDMARPFGAQPNAGAVIEPQAVPPGLLPRHLETLSPPDPLNHRQADLPARLLWQSMDLAVAVSPVPLSQFDYVCRQALLVGVVLGRFALRRTMLPDH